MEEQSVQNPRLRFSEFAEVWKPAKLGEIADFRKGALISKEDTVPGGQTECVRYGELYTVYGETIDSVLSRTNLDEKELIFSEENDVIIPASGETNIDIARAACILREGIALGGDLNIIRSPMNGVFLSYYLNSRKRFDIARLAQGVSVVHLYPVHLKALNLRVPELEEQQKIAGFLSAVDERIGQLVRKKELLLKYKKGVMQQIFSQNMRFKDPNGNPFPDWEEKRLGELTERFEIRNRSKRSLPVYSISNQHGFVPQAEQFDGVNSELRGYDTSQYKVIENDTWAYNPARINVGSIGFSGKIGTVQVSSLYVCFKTSEDLEDAYLEQYLDTRSFLNDVLRNVEGGVRDYLFYNNFARISVPLPSVAEQNRIADFLSSIDVRIESVGGQIEKTKTFKKGLLQQMFV